MYGYERDTTPFLDRFTDEAVLYEQARAPGIHSIASHASIWTGDEVEEHGLMRHEDALEPGVTVWEHLRDAGFRTGLFTTNPVVTHASNLSDAFETVVTDEIRNTEEKLFPEAHSPVDVRDYEGLSGNLGRIAADANPAKAFANSVYHFYLKLRPTDGESLTSWDLVERFDTWQSAASGPWAACLNLMDAHYPYEPVPEYDRWGDSQLRAFQSEMTKPPSYEYTHGRPWWQLEAARHLYDGAIRQVDAVVERIVDALQEAGELDDTLFVVTSDHGEGFGEYSQLEPSVRLVDHSWGIDEVLTHVPLLVRFPGQSDSRRVSEPVSLSSFPDVIADLVDGDAAPDSFVSDSPVITSTERLLDEDAVLFSDTNLDPSAHTGPWRAVYERVDGTVRKHARRGDSARTFEIRDAQHSYPAQGPATERIDAAFAGLADTGVKRGTETVDASVEDRLGDLGYLR